MVFTGPVFTALFKVSADKMPKYAAGASTSGKEFFVFFIAIFWCLFCHLFTLYFLYNFTETPVHEWVIFYVFALAIEFLVVQLIKAAVKYGQLSGYAEKKGSSFVEYLRQT
jgi:hypothetical protein